MVCSCCSKVFDDGVARPDGVESGSSLKESGAPGASKDKRGNVKFEEKRV